jgi:phenylpyruvate tautomerase PptA (4-oxalocrotonate tautomerase family)
MPMIDVYAAAGTLDIVAAAADDPSLQERTWVLLTESPEGGWGIGGHANTNTDIAAGARAALACQ